MKIITESMVKKRVNFSTAFKAIEKSYQLFSAGKTTAPPTASMSVNSGMFYSFPAYINGDKFFISKQATDYRHNKAVSLPTVHPYILVFNSKTGVLKSIIEGRYFAAVRTALSSAVGIKYLSKKPKRLAILGSGIQGQSHACILPKLFRTIKEVHIYSPTKKHRESAVKEIKKVLKIHVQATDNPDDAVMNADVIVTATSSSQPVFKARSVKKGALIIGVGAMKNDQEIPSEIMSGSLVIVDSKTNVPMYDEINKTEKLGMKVRVIGEIGSIINKDIKIKKGATIVFKHHGLPVTDAALAGTL